MKLLVLLPHVTAVQIAGSNEILETFTRRVGGSGDVAITRTGAWLFRESGTAEPRYGLRGEKDDGSDVLELLRKVAEGRTHLLAGDEEADELVPGDTKMDLGSEEDDGGNPDFWEGGIRITRGKRVRLDELGDD